MGWLGGGWLVVVVVWGGGGGEFWGARGGMAGAAWTDGPARQGRARAFERLGELGTGGSRSTADPSPLLLPHHVRRDLHPPHRVHERVKALELIGRGRHDVLRGVDLVRLERGDLLFLIRILNGVVGVGVVMWSGGGGMRQRRSRMLLLGQKSERASERERPERGDRRTAAAVSARSALSLCLPIARARLLRGGARSFGSGGAPIAAVAPAWSADKAREGRARERGAEA